MLKNEWLERENNVVSQSNKKAFESLYSHINGFLDSVSNSVEIDDSKSVEDCYKNMEKYAEEHQEDGCYCFTDEEEKEFVLKYLNLKIEDKTEIINLSDFL